MLDTSVVVDLDRIDEESLPHDCSVAAITLAELSAGIHASKTLEERSLRQHVLQYIEGTFATAPFDAAAARAYGRVYVAVAEAGRKPRGGRADDLLIAATALSRALPLFTRNPRDFANLRDLMDIVAI